MIVYTYSEARQKLAQVLDEATHGDVCITRKDGQRFIIKNAPKKTSPLDVVGVDTDISSSEILDFIQESRKYQ